MTALALACELCGLERGPGAPERFCCAGCLNVFAILQESGMVQPGVDLRDSELFRKSLELGLVSNASARKRAAIPPGTTTEERLFRVSGMWCASCAWLIEHCLLREYGVASADVFFASDLVKVRFHPQYLPPDRIVQRIESLGYKASEYRPGEESSEAAKEKRDLTLRLGVAAFLWVNVMMLNLSVFIGVFQRLPEGIRGVLPFVVMALASPVILYSARPVFRAAWIGLKNRVVRMETLLALGIAAAYGYSTMQAFTGGTHIYFDISCAIVTLVLIGKQIERGAKEKAAHAITSMYRMLPNKARAYVDGREHFISIEALKSGDQFVVKVGERMPADGIVVEGESHADESLLTGESAPVMKSAGSVVVCGSVNTSGVLRIRATTVGDESTLARILQTVERALISRSSIERIVDRVSRYFVPAVIVLSSLTFVGWRVAGGIDTGDALMRAITVLVIACPCALGIATPLALTAAVGAASRHGILVGDSRVLETLRKVDTLVLDKTGTVTEADFSPVEFRQEHLQRLASLEVNSEHPLGMAVVREARRLGMPLDRATDVNVHKGLGISGSIGGTRVFAGNRRMVPAFGDALDRQAQEWESRGLTVAFYGWDAEVQGAVAFGCRIKPGTRELVDQLQQKGLRVLLVSGDSYATTAWTASQIGVDEFEAEALPDDKAKILERLRGAGNVVAMVGDGVNDAPALAQADLGIAMGSGAEIAMQAAAMVLMNSQLTNVLTAFDLAHATMRVIRQNLFWAFFYNVAGITFAVAGFLNPIMAAGAMIVSSLSVVGNSYRLSRSGNLKA